MPRRGAVEIADLVGEASEKIYIYDRMHDREGAFVLLSAYIEQRRDEHVALFEA